MVNRESPTIAGDIPIEFVVVLEKSQLAIRCVRKLVGVIAVANKSVPVTEINAFSVGIVLDARSLRLTIPKCAAEAEANCVVVSKTIFVACGELAIDAVANLISGAEHDDGLFYQESSLIKKTNVAVKVPNALGLCGGCDAQQREQRQRTENAKEGAAHKCGCHDWLPSMLRAKPREASHKERFGYWRIGDTNEVER